MRLAGSDTFGRRLVAIRASRGLTRAELAALIGRSKQTIRRWEQQSRPIEIRQSDAAKCARALRCRLKALLAPLDEPIPALPLFWPRTRRLIKQRLAAIAGKRPPYRIRNSEQTKNQIPTGIGSQLTTESRTNSQPAKRMGLDAADELLTPLEHIRALIDKCSLDDLQILVADIIEKTIQDAIDHRPTLGQNRAKYDA